MHFESKQDFVFVRQITYYAAQRQWQLLDQGRRGEDFLVFGALRILEHIDDLEVVLALELLIADTLQISDCDSRPGAGAGDVKGQQILGQKSSSLTAPWIARFKLGNGLLPAASWAGSARSLH